VRNKTGRNVQKRLEKARVPLEKDKCSAGWGAWAMGEAEACAFGGSVAEGGGPVGHGEVPRDAAHVGKAGWY